MLDVAGIAYSINGIEILVPQSFTLASRQHTLLLGASGCGKTTLLNLMAGLLRATKGDLAFNGQSYSQLSGSALDKLRAENFGFVFQKLHLIGHLNAAQNIAVAQTRNDNAQIKRLLDDLGLSALANRKARDLSVGEAQRVAIARAVANNPKIIFADEPTSSLDDANTDTVMDLIFTQAEKTGATIIAATHDARIKSRFSTVLEVGA